MHLLYVSPLKALNNDVQRNLETPLAQLKARFEAAGRDAFPRSASPCAPATRRPRARARMLRKTPHILITTPESLHILLTSVRGRTMFSALRAVIVDEIHAVAGTKRGAHLALTLERLATLAPDAPQRIGLSRHAAAAGGDRAVPGRVRAAAATGTRSRASAESPSSTADS